MIALSENCVTSELMEIPKILIIPTLHIMRGYIKAQMRCVGRTNPQILRSKVSSPIAKADAKVAVIHLD